MSTNEKFNIKKLSENSCNEKFLFFFTPKKVDLESCCGFSLRSGIKLVSIYLLIAAIYYFCSILKEESWIEIILSILISLCYLISAFYLYLSTIYLEYSYCKIGNIIYTLIFYFDIINCFIVSIRISTNQIYLLFNSIIITQIIFLIMQFISILIELYMLWIGFCYLVHIKMERLNIVYGDNLHTILIQ